MAALRRKNGAGIVKSSAFHSDRSTLFLSGLHKTNDIHSSR